MRVLARRHVVQKMAFLAAGDLVFTVAVELALLSLSRSVEWVCLAFKVGVSGFCDYGVCLCFLLIEFV